jgi:hypothetical protein
MHLDGVENGERLSGYGCIWDMLNEGLSVRCFFFDLWEQLEQLQNSQRNLKA